MHPVLSVFLVVLLGAAAGTVSALLGIGSGILMVPLLMFVWGKNIHAAIGTSLGLMIFLVVAGALRHHISYHAVDWPLALALAAGGVIGATFIGAPLSNALKSAALARIFGVLLVIVGLKMLGFWAFLARVSHLTPSK